MTALDAIGSAARECIASEAKEWPALGAALPWRRTASEADMARNSCEVLRIKRNEYELVGFFKNQ